MALSNHFNKVAMCVFVCVCVCMCVCAHALMCMRVCLRFTYSGSILDKAHGITFDDIGEVILLVVVAMLLQNTVVAHRIAVEATGKENAQTLSRTRNSPMVLSMRSSHITGLVAMSTSTL